MFEWIASNFGLAATIAAAILCGAGGLAFSIRLIRRQAESDVPWLLRCGMCIALVTSLFSLPVVLGGLAGLIEFEGDLPPRGEIEVLGAVSLVLAVLGTAAVGYYFGRPWSRPLAVAFWPVVWGCLAIQSRWSSELGRGELLLAGAELLVLVIVSGWYFYRKATVVSYFEGLERAA